jgi:hypothetical protein
VVIVCCLCCWQVVMTSIEPKGGRKGAGYDAFEYTAHSHTYMSDSQPTAKFTYDLSPIQVRAAGSMPSAAAVKSGSYVALLRPSLSVVAAATNQKVYSV